MRGHLLAMVVICLGCGNVKSDGDASTGDDGPNPTDGPPGIDGTPGTIDASCSVACQAPDDPTNGQPQLGTAACVQNMTAACDPNDPASQYLRTTDVCGCSAGTPSLFVSRQPPQLQANIAVLLPLNSGAGTWSLQTSTSCYLGSNPCPQVACPMGAYTIWAWTNVQLPMTGGTVSLYDDSTGIPCGTSGLPRYTFQIPPG